MIEKTKNIPIYSYDKVTQQRKASPLHYHDDYELYFLLEGETKYFIGNEIFHVHQGDFIFVPKNVFHKTDSEECLYNERIVISFNDEIFSADMLPILEDLTAFKLIHISSDKLHILKDLILQIELENKRDKKHKDLIITNCIKQLLIQLCRLRSFEPSFINKKDEFMYTISKYIKENISEDISLLSLSKTFAISKCHLSRTFKAVMKTGINEYIKYTRIMTAERLLRETALPITTVAQSCGFNDSNYFSTVFKKTIGVTPLKYRFKNAGK